MKTFNSFPRIVQFILLLIPGVNWITEIIVRCSAMLEHKDVLHIVVFICVLIFGLPFGWVDLVWVLLFKHLILAA